MKKEVFLAILVGFVLGLIITFGIWTANKSLNNFSSPSPTPTLAASPTPSPVINQQPTTNNLPLTLTSPDDEALVNTNTVTVSGSTTPGAAVTITYETSETILYVDNTGLFSADIKLEGGYNRITLTAFDRDGNTAKKQLLVTYTTSKI